MRQDNKDQEKLLLSQMHIVISKSSPAVRCSVPFQKPWLGTQDRDLPGWVCPPGPPQLGADVPMPPQCLLRAPAPQSHRSAGDSTALLLRTVPGG